MSDIFLTAPNTWPGMLDIAARAMAVYLAAVLILRVGKSRTLGRATPMDIILALILGSMFSRAINGSALLLPTLAGGLVLMLLHWGFTEMGRRWSWWNHLMNGRAIPLILEGQIQSKNLARTEISESDLQEALRLRGGGVEIGQVAEARLERNGRISILTRHP